MEKNRRSSIVWRIDREDLQNMLDTSSSICEVLRRLGLSPYNGNHRTLLQRIKEDCLNQDILTKNRNLAHGERLKNSRKIPTSDILSAHSRHCQAVVKNRVVQEKLIEYKCSDCGNPGLHNGKRLSLQLDHINGDNTNNLIENLRFLCPNCHSQTATFSGRSAKRLTTCKDCGSTISDKRCSKEFCDKCRSNRLSKAAQSQKRFDPSKEELINKLKEVDCNILAVGRFYGVSDNAVRKRCAKFDILYKTW